MTGETEGPICPECNREIRGGAPNRTQLLFQEHRTHLAAQALAAGGHVEGVVGSYGCETGCEYVRYTVYDAKGTEIAVHGEFADLVDPDTLREWANYYGVRVES